MLQSFESKETVVSAVHLIRTNLFPVNQVFSCSKCSKKKKKKQQPRSNKHKVAQSKASSVKAFCLTECPVLHSVPFARKIEPINCSRD